MADKKTRRPGIVRDLPADDPRSMLSENGKARLAEFSGAMVKSLIDKVMASRFGDVVLPNSFELTILQTFSAGDGAALKDLQPELANAIVSYTARCVEKLADKPAK